MSDVPLAIGIDFGGTSVKTGVLYRGNLIEEAPRIDTQEFEEARGYANRGIELYPENVAMYTTLADIEKAGIKIL